MVVIIVLVLAIILGGIALVVLLMPNDRRLLAKYDERENCVVYSAEVCGIFGWRTVFKFTDADIKNAMKVTKYAKYYKEGEK